MTSLVPALQTRPAALSLTTIVAVLLDRFRFILVVSLLMAALLFCISLALPDKFKATVLVMPPDHSSSAAMSMLGAASGSSAAIASGALAGLGIKNPADLYVALMLSPVVEDEVISRFDLAKLYNQRHLSLVRKKLEANTQILADPKSGIISVAVIDKDPQRASNLANAIVATFEKFSSQLAITDAARRRLFFERQVAETKQDLTRAENTLLSTTSKTGVLEPEGSVRAMIGYEAQLRSQVATKTVELQSMKVYLSDDNPQVQVATRELQSLRQQADSLEAKNGSGYSKTEESTGSLDYVRALRQVKADETLYELLLKNLEIAKLDEARDGNIVQIVSPATAPDLKDSPHRSFFAIGGFLLGMTFSSLWSLLHLAKSSVLDIVPAEADHTGGA